MEDLEKFPGVAARLEQRYRALSLAVGAANKMPALEKPEVTVERAKAFSKFLLDDDSSEQQKEGGEV